MCLWDAPRTRSAVWEHGQVIAAGGGAGFVQAHADSSLCVQHPQGLPCPSTQVHCECVCRVNASVWSDENGCADGASMRGCKGDHQT